MREGSHIPDEDLLLAADGELPARRAAEVQAHLEACWSCRTRRREIEEAIADYVHSRDAVAPALPPAGPARSRLTARMAEMAAESRAPFWRRMEWRAAAVVLCAGILAVAIGLQPARRASAEARAIPDPRLTPGATLPVTRADLCGEGFVEGARIVPAAVARQVFAAYGIDTPEPRAYEVDYLISPALGGADQVRNFWPQPYGNTIWTANTKDALEDRLHGLVCAGEVDLATAQQEIARDWIAAYKKYFHTDRPLPEHFSFLKDRPWE